MVVGLTGGIGSGKSTVAALLERRGAAIIDTDRIAREIVEPPSPVLDRLVQEFGAGILAADGNLDRAELARLSLGDKRKQARINELTHPEIARRALEEIKRYRRDDVVIVLAPLLFESGFDRHCDLVVAVVAPAGVRAERLKEKGELTPEDIAARMRAQLSDEEFERRAQIVIRNDSDLRALEGEVETAWTTIKKRFAM